MRRIAVPVLVCLTGVLLLVALPAAYVRSQLLDRERLTERVGAAVTSEPVRAVAAQRIVDAAVDAGAEELLVTRPIAISGIEALLGTPVVRQLARGAAADAHSLLVTGEEGTFVLDLGRGTALVLEGLRSVSPRIAAAVPETFDPEVLRVPADDPALVSVRRLAGLGGAIAWIAPLLALASAAAALLLGSADRRRVLAGLGAAVAASSALLLVLLAVARDAAVPGAEAGPDVAAAAGALWDALLGDLGVWAQTLLLAGAVLAVVAAARREEGGAVSRLLGTVSRVRTAGTPRWRAARAGALLAAAALLAWEPALALRLTAIGLAVYAIAELAAVLDATSTKRAARRAKAAKAARRAGEPPAARGRAGRLADATRTRLAPRVAIPLLAVVAAVAVAAALTAEAPQPPAVAAAPPSGCNGPRAYCELRLDEYTFAATHNSFAAAQEPGWLIPNQRFGIARQLGDGVRGFLLDVHVGVRTDKLVRTDLQAEGGSRNKVGRTIGAENLATAERLAGRIGAGELRGRRELFLCHTVCELGAVPAREQLRAFGRFLDRNRGEVLVFMVEPYVPAKRIERLFREAGLLDDVVTLDPGAPLPTLGDLVRADRRLLVFTEQGGGELPWYMPMFSWFQDTPLGATEPAELSCARSRGDGDSPLLLVNHWIDTFPPSPRRNRAIGGDFLARRLARCERAREMRANVVAVDFHERSGVVAAVRELNDRAARAARALDAVE